MTLSQLLRSEDKQGRMPVKISEYAVKLNDKKVVKESYIIKELKDRLETVTNSEQFFKDEKLEISKEERTKFLSDIITEKEALQGKLSLMVEFTPMRLSLDDEESKEDLIEHLMVLTAWLSSQVNIGKPLTGNQSEFVAITIIDKYAHLSVDEVLLCFKNALGGEYGQIYDRIDVTIICQWLKSYSDNKRDRVILIESQKHTQGKGAIVNKDPSLYRILNRKVK